MKTKKWNKKIIIPLIVVFAALYSFRVWYVNSNAAQVYEKKYEIGDWVPLEGDYIATKGENTDGYSLQLSEVEVLSYEDFMARYNKSTDYLAEKSRHHVILLTLNIKNESSDGYLYLSFFTLLNKYFSCYYSFDSTYESICEPKINSGYGQASINIQPNSEYTLKVAYTSSVRADGVSFLQEEASKGHKTADLYLSISWYPTKKYIHFTVPIPENPQ